MDNNKLEKIIKLELVCELISKCKEIIQIEDICGGHRGDMDDTLSMFQNDIYNEIECLKKEIIS